MSNTLTAQHPLSYQQLMERTRKEGDCNVWTGTIAGGSVQVYDPQARKMFNVRLLVWNLMRPADHVRSGNDLAMTCGTRFCVNPAHMVLRGSLEHDKAKGLIPPGAKQLSPPKPGHCCACGKALANLPSYMAMTTNTKCSECGKGSFEPNSPEAMEVCQRLRNGEYDAPSAVGPTPHRTKAKAEPEPVREVPSIIELHAASRIEAESEPDPSDILPGLEPDSEPEPIDTPFIVDLVAPIAPIAGEDLEPGDVVGRKDDGKLYKLESEPAPSIADDAGRLVRTARLNTNLFAEACLKMLDHVDFTDGAADALDAWVSVYQAGRRIGGAS